MSEKGFREAFGYEVAHMIGAGREYDSKVREERKRQDAKWGVNMVDDRSMMVILMEEVGELAKEVLENPAGSNLDKELVQCGAVLRKLYELRSARRRFSDGGLSDEQRAAVAEAFAPGKP